MAIERTRCTAVARLSERANIPLHCTSPTIGQHHCDTPTLKPANSAATKDEYTAPLTGNIWMSASHLYLSSEVDAYMPVGTRAEVVQAIKSIYDLVLPGAHMRIEGPARGTDPAYRLDVKFEDSDNPRQNIINFQLLSDGLSRVHPGGYAALFNSATPQARASQISK